VPQGQFRFGLVARKASTIPALWYTRPEVASRRRMGVPEITEMTGARVRV